jgi:hypothetical protein
MVFSACVVLSPAEIRRLELSVFPHHYARDFSVIVDYLEASSELLTLYIDKCKAFGWDKVAKLSL